MSLAPISNDNIRVGYISDTGYVSGVSVSDANKYEENNPNTTFIFIDGDKKVKYLTIDEVNNLTTSDLIIVDDGAGGTNRKAALSRMVTLMAANLDDPTALAIALG